MALAVEVAGKTDIGCVRSNNEDSFAYDIDAGIFVVCDGMGGGRPEKWPAVWRWKV